MQARAVDVEPRAVGERVARAGGGVAEDRLLRDEVDHVHAEAVDAAVEPAAHHGVHRLAHLGVLPVQIGLLAVEQVEVVLPGRRIPFPHRAGEERLPVGRLRAGFAAHRAGPGRAPRVPVALRAVAARARLLEPRVLVGRVVHDEVHDELHAARVQGRDQLVEVAEGPEHGVDVLVVADVVSVVRVRAAVHRRQPHDVHTQALEVVEAPQDAAEVADAVTVGVLEAARPDLVDDGALPPSRLVGHRAPPRSLSRGCARRSARPRPRHPRAWRRSPRRR